jgi:hypothetical protein
MNLDIDEGGKDGRHNTGATSGGCLHMASSDCSKTMEADEFDDAYSGSVDDDSNDEEEDYIRDETETQVVISLVHLLKWWLEIQMEKASSTN